MNRYLLLRDNKQSGPYTVQELETKRLKPYDLVWLEGQSAAWRYPSEIPELKAFAPTVEEQPFDRFFKKQSESADQDGKEKVEEKPKFNPASSKKGVEKIAENGVEKITPGIKSQPKQIYVTLPRATFQSPYTKKEAAEKVAPEKNLEKTNDVSAQTGSGTESNEQSSKKEPITSSNRKYQQTATNFSNYGQLKEEEKVALGPHVKRKNRGQTINTFAVFFILLVGIGIGFTLSYISDLPGKPKLSTLVQGPEEKTKETSRNLPLHFIPVKNDSVVLPQMMDDEQYSGEQQTDIEESSTDLLTQSGSEIQEIVPSIPPVAKKGNRIVRNKTVRNSASLPTKDDQEKIDLSTESKVSEEPQSSEASRELARKNLMQHLFIQNNKYKTGILGGISDLQLHLSNKSSYQLESVEVEINYLSPEKKVVKSQTVTFQNVAPGEIATLSAPKSNRGVEVNYIIKKVSSKELGIAQN